MFGQTNEAKLLFRGLAAFYAKMEPIAYTIMRIVVGATMIVHGYPKVFVAGLDRVGNAFATNYGLPYSFAYLAAFFEIVGGSALVLGFFTRFFSAALAIQMLIALFAEHWAKGFIADKGGYEFVMLLGFVFFHVAIRGGGLYSVDAKIGKEL